MMVMPSNNAGLQIGYLAGKYEGRIGWLCSADNWKEPPPWMPFALDNGAFPAWTNGKPWDEAAFYALLERTRGRTHKPLWVAVPDVVADRQATLRSWWAHSPRVAEYGVPLAFVVQDGMTPGDVPAGAEWIFVGGTTSWKWRHLKTWTGSFERVHVGRVNSERLLWMAHNAGARSCDGTGWMRGRREQLAELFRYLEHSTNGRPEMDLAI